MDTKKAVMLTMLVTAVFWLGWDLLVGPIPWVKELFLLQKNDKQPDWILTLPFAVPRHLDFLVLPFFVWLTKRLPARMPGDEFIGGLGVGLIVGLIGGLIVGLIGGLIVGLIVGLIGGLIVGLIVGLGNSLGYSLGFGFIVAIIYGGPVGLLVCFGYMLVIHLVVSVVKGIKQVFTSDSKLDVTTTEKSPSPTTPQTTT